jgi:hypothetical protein
MPRIRTLLGVASTAAVLLTASTFAATPAMADTTTIEAQFAQPGPFPTTSTTTADYAIFRPSDYAALGRKSPIVTWGNGSGSTPGQYSTLLNHFASYGITVIATTSTTTGSGNGIAAAANYLVAQESTPGSVFNGKLDVTRIAAVGHSQGAAGATRAASFNHDLISTLMTYSMPDIKWAGTGPECPVIEDCLWDTSLVTQPAFIIGTYGMYDSSIAPPNTELDFYNRLPATHSALGLVATSNALPADHYSVEDQYNPGGFLGYSTAWLCAQLFGDPTAAGAFAPGSAELPTHWNWPGSQVR